MIHHIKGLHHVTSFAGDAQANNRFFTQVLGLRRVKKTVNFDAPDVYHLYYGDALGTPGSVMTYFPFPNIGKAKPGTGEVSLTAFSVPAGSLPFWQSRLASFGVNGLALDNTFGEQRLHFTGVDGDRFALVETVSDTRPTWVGGGIAPEFAIRGFHSTMLRLQDAGATAELLSFMGYKPVTNQGLLRRFSLEQGNGANVIDVETLPNVAEAKPGSGSVHHVAFAVENRARQLEVRKALVDAGFAVTPVIDRDYFFSIYFKTPGGVLFEVATNEPGFDRDEDRAHLGEVLKLPAQHEHLRGQLEQLLQPIVD